MATPHTTARSISAAIKNINQQRERLLKIINNDDFTVIGPEAWAQVYQLSGLNDALGNMERRYLAPPRSVPVG